MTNSKWCLLFLCWIVTSSGQSTDNFVAQSVAKLSSIILKSAGKQNANLVYSPLSISTGLAMLYEGMSDESRIQVGQALGYPSNHDEFLSQQQLSIGSVTSNSTANANIMVVSDESNMKLTYATTIQDVFKANPFRENFKKNPRKSLKNINKMVSNRTKQKINDLMPEGSIKESTSLVLINVLYFQSNWKQPFDSDLVPGSFTTEQRGAVNLDVMTSEMDIGYLKTQDGIQILSLPFEDANYAMIVVMLSESLARFIDNEKASSEVLGYVINPNSLPVKNAQVHLPPFAVESRIEVKTILSTDPSISHFFNSSADYSRLSPQSVNVDDVNHKAVINVTTGGVEAAAATGITVTLYSAFNPENIVKVDKPFLFFIVKKPTQTILFTGFVSDPKN